MEEPCFLPSLLTSTVTIEDVGGAAIYLLSELSRAVTGEIHYVDAGYNIASMPQLETLKRLDSGEEQEAAE